MFSDVQHYATFQTKLNSVKQLIFLELDFQSLQKGASNKVSSLIIKINHSSREINLVNSEQKSNVSESFSTSIFRESCGGGRKGLRNSELLLLIDAADRPRFCHLYSPRKFQVLYLSLLLPSFLPFIVSL
jgi:hypothetical protein